MDSRIRGAKPFSARYPLSPVLTKATAGGLLAVMLFFSFQAAAASVHLKKALAAQDTSLPLAYSHVSRSLAHNPHHVVSRFLAGRIYLQSNEPEKALAEFEAARRLNPGVDTVYHNIGLAYQQMGMAEKAASFYAYCLYLNPDRPETLNNLAVLHMQADRYRQARQALEKALALDPSSRTIRDNLDRLPAE